MNTPNPSDRSAFQIVQAHYAASDRRDIAAMMADVAAPVSWTEMAGFPCAGTYTSAAEIVEHVFMTLGASWTGFTFRLERLIDGGATITGIGTYSGTCTATGKAMEARVVHVWDVDGAKIVRFEQFCDTYLVRAAMQA